jgi:predicted helicase
MLNFVKLESDLARMAYKLGKDSRDWTVKTAQEDILASGPSNDRIKRILYRPFDERWTYYTGQSRGIFSSPQVNVMRQMFQPNLALCVGRAGQVVGIEHDWNIVFCAATIADFNLFYRGGNVTFPLYLYPDPEKSKRRHGFSLMLFESEAPYGKGQRIPNIASGILAALTSAYQRELVPEQIFHYIYAILYTKAYRQKYAEFLKTDFPRVPFTNDYLLFEKIAGQGAELVALHLLKSGQLTKPITRFEGSGDLRVVKVTYGVEQQQVQINPDQYFTGVPSAVWEYHIGGYQVVEKWLKDRKGRFLSSEEITIYVNLITAIAATIRIQASLDELFNDVESDLLEIPA